MLTRSLNISACLSVLTILFATAHCATEDEPFDYEGESESESEDKITGDNPCPPEGCATDIACAPSNPCPNDNPCRIYSCNAASATCFWNILDQDSDGFAPQGCDGQDCDDTPLGNTSPAAREKCFESGRDYFDCGGHFIYPGAEEICNGRDDDCNGKIDEEIETQSCGPQPIGICQPGTQTCANGKPSECVGAVYPMDNEICDDKQDNDCDGATDEEDEECGDFPF